MDPQELCVRTVIWVYDRDLEGELYWVLILAIVEPILYIDT
jgi:hypothetical protein